MISRFQRTLKYLMYSFLFSLFLLSSAQPANSQGPIVSAQRRARTTSAPAQQWIASIDPMFRRPVTTSSAAYYAGETLMVPLHAAFALDNSTWEKEFSDYFQRNTQSPEQITDIELSRLQFLYLTSQFIVLAKSANHEELIPPGLPDFVFSEVEAAWRFKSATEWEHAPFHGMRDLVLYKLETHKVAKSYFRAIQDDEIFLFAIAADLKAYRGTTTQQREWNDVLDDVLEIAHRVFTQEVTFDRSGGWVFQPGVYADHPDFQYAGNERPEPGMQKKLASYIGWDSSHSLRFPLWITSLMNAYPRGSALNVFYSNLRDGLAKQFFTKVLVEPSASSPCYRVNNFMDGSNGVYRWGYGSFGPNNGYGPYGISGSLLLGWWAFIGTAQSKALYTDIAGRYPWPKECIELYLGPAAASHPYTSSDLDPNSPVMQSYYLLVSLASQL